MPVVLAALIGFNTGDVAAETPPGCTTNDITLGLTTIPNESFAGQVITYTVDVSIPPFPTCQVQDIHTSLTLPDGTVVELGNIPEPPSIGNNTLNPGTGHTYGDVQYLADPNDLVPCPAPNQDKQCWVALAETDGISQVGAFGAPASNERESNVIFLDCNVELTKCVKVDTNADGSFDDEICFSDEDGPALGLLNHADKPLQYEFTVDNTGIGDLGGCFLEDPSLNLFQQLPDIPIGQSLTLDPVDGGICDAELKENTAVVRCDLCQGLQNPEPAIDEDSASVECVECGVSVDKQISCDGGISFVDVDGESDGDVCIGWTTTAEVVYRYVVENTGDVDLASCDLTETNQGVTPNEPVALVVGEMATVDFGPLFCDDTNEPDTAVYNCICQATSGGQLINDSVLNFGQNDTEDSDSADLICQTPELSITKVCDAQDANGVNAVTITVDNTGDAPLADCQVTDTPDAGVATLNNPGPHDLPGGGSVQVTGEITGITENNTNNTASVTCDIVGTTKQISAEDSDLCEVPGDGCLTRTPGYWKNHADIGELFIAGAGIQVCGAPLEDQNAILQGMCVSGAEAKRNNLTQTDLQIVRQCVAAAINIEASLDLDGNCEGEYPGITAMFNACCGTDDVCTDGQYSVTNCIESLDDFNNQMGNELDDTSLCPNTDLGTPLSADNCGAQTVKACQQASKDGVVLVD